MAAGRPTTFRSTPFTPGNAAGFAGGGALENSLIGSEQYLGALTQGAVDTVGNSNVAFANGTSCMTVNTASPGLTFRQNGQSATFAPNGFNTSALQSGGTYTVVLGGTTGALTPKMDPSVSRAVPATVAA